MSNKMKMSFFKAYIELDKACSKLLSVEYEKIEDTSIKVTPVENVVLHEDMTGDYEISLDVVGIAATITTPTIARVIIVSAKVNADLYFTHISYRKIHQHLSLHFKA